MACKPVPCFGSVRVFGVCLAALFFFHGALYQYSFNILEYLGRTFPIANYEQNFIIGVQAIGFVIVLLFVAFFGNRMHRPLAISAGAMLSAIGSALCGVLYFMVDQREFEEDVSRFVRGGVCGTYQNNTATHLFQCDFLNIPDEKLTAFSVLSAGHFFIGFGSAFYASLGLVHIEENTNRPESALFIGIVMGLHGLGQFTGTLFAMGFTGLPESASGELPLISELEHPGAWWLGFLIIGGGLLLVSSLFVWFPKWFQQPAWLTRRKARYKAKCEQDKKRSQQKRRRRARITNLRKKRRSIDKHGRKDKRKRKRNSDKAKRRSSENEADRENDVVNGDIQRSRTASDAARGAVERHDSKNGPGKHVKRISSDRAQGSKKKKVPTATLR